MVHTTVTGNSKRVSSDELIIAANFLGDKLLGSRMSKNVGIEIQLTPGLRRKKNAYGLFHIMDDAPNPREFDIMIDSGLGRKDIFEAVCHEMVHVKQAVRGELREATATKMLRWMGVEQDESIIDYWDRAWEIEAHGRERGLYLHLMHHFDTIGI